ncbi:hypothetical protein SISSUDRAFT_1130492 [Sistotremastrum suecicum HHB10207 ss-3]|uniref:F-box domain-containing protein n=1 Tax=Sistotremastrum suecicum HHB10207 ss-3 TaxID=1314776 RepID=A0A166BED2_9AGAM|nr:hypothetical protein SISSUDRAFT_1130492 [Sistotremastrum suecicum HHB10207 ss-3]
MNQESATATQSVADDAPHFSIPPLLPVTQRILVPEIIGAILDALINIMGSNKNAAMIDRQLLKVAQCSRLFQEEAERRLYAYVKFTVGTSRAAKIAAVLRSRTARYLRVLHVMEYGDERSFRDNNMSTVAGLPFELMTGLKEMEVHFAYGPSAYIKKPLDERLFQILRRDLPENTLQVFRCARPLNRSSIRFLYRQRTLEELLIKLNAFEPNAAEVLVDRMDFPNLRMIVASPIEHPSLCWILQRSDIQYLTPLETFSIIPPWSSFSQQLITLDVAHCQALDPKIVKEIVSSSPHLRLLMLKLNHLWEEKNINVFDTLRRLANLEVLGLLPDPTTFNSYFNSIVGRVNDCEALQNLAIVVPRGGPNEYFGVEMTKSKRRGWTQKPTGAVDIISWKAEHVSRIEMSRKKASASA